MSPRAAGGLLLAALAAAGAGCGPKPPPAPAFSWADTPRVPSPSAGTYSSAVAQPPDPGVAQLMGERPWDSALAGAAAGLALALVDGEGGLTAPEVREAAWRAGWPYPIARAEAWPAPTGSAPPSAVAEWLARQPPELSVGLVRVRGRSRDLWLGLASRARQDLGILPRQLPRGGQLLLPAIPGARALVADPVGRLSGGELHAPWSTTTEEPGEWLVEVRDEEGPLAVFPVYVGLVPPELTLLVPGDPPRDEEQALREVDRRLAEVRDAYGLRPFQPDPLLAAAAVRAFQTPSVTVEDLSGPTGVPASRLWRMGCVGATVESCLDSLAWDVRSRPGLLAEEALVGRVVEVGEAGVHLVLVVGSP